MTTKLEAINIMLSCIGHNAINTLEGVKSAFITTAENILNSETKRVQLQSYDFNTENNYPLIPDVDGYIKIPENVVSIIYPQDYLNRFTVRKGKLYDKFNHSFIIKHNYYYTSDTKAQSAWHKWTLEQAQRILNVDFIDNWLYLTVQYQDGVYLEKMNCTQKQEDGSLGFLVHLDRKINAVGTYNEEKNQTTYILPYEIDENLLNIINAQNGFLLDYIKNDKTITIDGKYIDLIIGEIYTSYWHMGTIYKKRTTQSGGSQAIEGILMLRDLELVYSNSGYFDVKLEPLYTVQAPSHFICTCIDLGTNSAVLGKVNIDSGTFLIPVLAKNDEIIISMTNNSYLPSTFSSITWIGELNIRGK